MQTVRDACQLQPNALSITLSDQIEQLDELITAEGDGTRFFEKTYITQGMQDLISEGMARLAGVSTQGVFHLKQAMGGGKTHLLVGFGLLAKHPALRKQYCGGLPYAQAFDVADIAAFNQDLNATILNLFDKVLFLIQRAGRPSQLVHKALDMTRDTDKPFDGEAQVEKTLTSNPLKLYLDVEKDFDPIRDKAQDRPPP